mmetsp:Transcript_2666/g.3510  ORF Transcript_2666/g.3510 Transcript_2666/m.3510 type:complete len:162 (-) Transcript_2666:365-850(-)
MIDHHRGRPACSPKNQGCGPWPTSAGEKAQNSTEWACSVLSCGWFCPLLTPGTWNQPERHILSSLPSPINRPTPESTGASGASKQNGLLDLPDMQQVGLAVSTQWLRTTPEFVKFRTLESRFSCGQQPVQLSLARVCLPHLRTDKRCDPITMPPIRQMKKR